MTAGSVGAPKTSAQPLTYTPSAEMAEKVKNDFADQLWASMVEPKL